MRTRDELNEALNGFLRSNYYAEDFELPGLFLAFVETLEPGEKDLMQDVLRLRLEEQPQPGLDILILFSVFPVDGAGPRLAALLSEQKPGSQLTRALIAVLRRYPGPEAYAALEPFLKGEFERDALRALAGMDFTRTLPHLKQALKKDHLLDLALHILHDRKKEIGMDRLIEELTRNVPLNARFVRTRLQASVLAKKGAFNPFTEAELQRLLHALQ